MSMNVRTSNAADAGNGAWDARKPHMKSLLLNHKPDFVGTQEASPAQYEFLKAVDGYGVIGECAGDCSSNERPFILYNEEDWMLLENGDFALSDNTEQLGSNTWGLAYNRGATWGRFRRQGSDATACVFNTHYDMANGHPKSSVLVASKMAALCKEQDLAMLTGDFNTDTGSEAMQYLLGKEASQGKTNSAFPLVSALDETGATGGTFIGNGVFQGALSSTRFDFVFAKAADLCIQKGEVIDERFDGNNAISDHAQVMATFCIGDDCSDCVGGSSAYGPVQNVPTPAPETPEPVTPVMVTPVPATEAPKPTEPIKVETPTPPVATPAATTATPVVTPAPTTPSTPNAVDSSAATVAPAGKPVTPSPTVSMRPDCDAQ